MLTIASAIRRAGVILGALILAIGLMNAFATYRHGLSKAFVTLMEISALALIIAGISIGLAWIIENQVKRKSGGEGNG